MSFKGIVGIKTADFLVWQFIEKIATKSLGVSWLFSNILSHQGWTSYNSLRGRTLVCIEYWKYTSYFVVIPVGHLRLSSCSAGRNWDIFIGNVSNNGRNQNKVPSKYPKNWFWKDRFDWGSASNLLHNFYDTKIYYVSKLFFVICSLVWFHFEKISPI